jgi:uncharacterized protein YegP (UPF0339 family)
MSQHFEYFTNKNDRYYFRLKAKNGQIILASQWYESKQSCLNGIESVKTNGKDLAQFELKNATDWSFYFVLKAVNNQIIGTSQMYTTKQSCENWIESVMTNAPDSPIMEVDE